MLKLYYKNKLLIFMSRLFENRRLFTPIQLSIYTLRDYGVWPQKLIALDAFCQTGLQWTRIFSKHASYLEMWDIDPLPLKYARKEFPDAEVVCGDSVEAFKQMGFKRKDFNFILADTPVPFMFPDGSFEHFGFFSDIFKNIAEEAVIIFDVVPDINKMLARHPHDERFTESWRQARCKFYNVSGGSLITPDKMINAYTRILNELGLTVRLIQYNARNEYFGFISLAVKR